MPAPIKSRGQPNAPNEPRLDNPPPELKQHAGDLLRRLFALLTLLKSRQGSEKRSVARQLCALCTQLSAELMLARWASTSAWAWFVVLLGNGIPLLGDKAFLSGKLLGSFKRLNGLRTTASNVLQKLKHAPKII